MPSASFALPHLAQLDVVAFRVHSVRRDELGEIHRVRIASSTLGNSAETKSRSGRRRPTTCRKSPRDPRRTPRRRSSASPARRRHQRDRQICAVVDSGRVLKRRRERGLRIAGSPPHRRPGPVPRAVCGHGRGGWHTSGRNASFIEGLSRHSHAVWTDVPGSCSSPHLGHRHGVRLDRGPPVDPNLSWIQRMASVKIPTSTTVGTWW